MTWRCLPRSSGVDGIEMYRKVLHSSENFMPCIVYKSILSRSTRAIYELRKTFLPEVLMLMLMLNDEDLNSCVPHAQGHPVWLLNFGEVHCDLSFHHTPYYCCVKVFLFATSQQE